MASDGGLNVHPDALALLACPQCPGQSLILLNPQTAEGRIDCGALHCPLCQADYPIHRAIPRFVGSPVEGWEALTPFDRVQALTARNFEEASHLYQETHSNPATEKQFQEALQPLNSANFAQKTVLDLGCGLGGFMKYAARSHPRHLFGLELSLTIESAADVLLAKHPQITLVQGDILHPPFHHDVFDLVYSVSALHHLPSPHKGFEAVVPLVKPDGNLFFAVNARENNSLAVYGLSPLRVVTSKLSVTWVRKLVALPLASLFWVLMHSLYSTQLGFKTLPYWQNLQSFKAKGWHSLWGAVTDQLIAPQIHYLSQPTLKAWIKQSSWFMDAIKTNNGTSWQVLCSPFQAKTPLLKEESAANSTLS